MKRTLLSEQIIHHIMDETTAQRGLLAFRKKQVHQLKDEDGIISAFVDDEKRERFSVFIRWKKGIPTGNCSCPTAFNCRHVAAVMFANIHADDEQQQTEEGDVPQTAVINPFSQWLGALDQRVPSKQKSSKTTGQCILYLLKQHPKHGLIITFHLTRRLKDSSYGQLQPYQPANALKASTPAYLQAIDQRILRMAADNYEASLRRYYQLRGEDDISMLKQLIATTRCHWQDPQSTPIQLGDTLPGQWQWQRDQYGCQQLSLLAEHPGLLLIPLSPPWYLDTDQGVCGRITAPELDTPIDILFNLPTIEPDISDEELSQLCTQLPEGVPHPTRLPYRKLSGHYTPVLELCSLPTPDIYRGILPEYIHIAELWMDFGEGQRYPWTASHEASVRVIDNNGITDYLRDPDKDESIQQLLLQYGLHHRVPWLTQAPLKDHQLTLMEARQWPQWMLEKQPKLATEGKIHVVTLPSFQHQMLEVEQWQLETHSDGWLGKATLRAQLSEGDQLDLNNAIAAWVEDHPDCLQAERLEEIRQTMSIALPVHHGRMLPIAGEMLANILYFMQQAIDQQNLGITQLVSLRKKLKEQKVQLNADPWLDKAKALLQNDLREKISPPAGLQAQLRDYQRECLDWLQMLARTGMHGLLADDMGLGKTLQALAHLLTEKETGRLKQPALVICPTSLVHNWANEAQRFTPELSVLILHGAERGQHYANLSNYHLIISTYPLLIRDFDVLQSVPWHIIILDEAQYIKNPNARSSQLVRQLQSNHRLCMTGTPMENHLGDLWSQFDFLMPGYLGEHKQFRRSFQLPIEQDGDEQRRQQLNARIRPFILRRRKEDVATELPLKTEILRTVDMENDQREIYEGIRLSMQQRVQQAISQTGMAQSHIIMLSALLRMRQACCDPRLLPNINLKHASSAKLDLLRDMLPELLDEGRRILLFSQFTSMLSLIEVLVQELDIPYVKLTGASKNRQSLIQRFQNGDVPLFLISLKAGGTGLNLTAADTVIHYDPWWNPAAEQQATDRAHRIGQDKPVFVYKIITEGTVEEKILSMQQRKQALAQQLHEAAESDIRSLTEQEIYSLFEPIR